MFNDRKKALEALEAELLLEELSEEEVPGHHEEAAAREQPLYRNYSNNYGNFDAYNVDIDDEETEDYAEEVRSGTRGSDVKVLTAVALGLLAGIFAVLAFWTMRYL